jgi:chloride channel 3/4/5
MQGWILMFVIGIASGCVAAAMDISTKWLSDLKQGYCTTNIALNRNFCCWNYVVKDECMEWVPWSWALAGVLPSSWTGHYINWFVFLFVGVGFATLSALLVNVTGIAQHIKPSTLLDGENAPNTTTVQYFAAGSGIPEVKTILSGFVIRGFLGFQTLWVKVVSLVLSVASGLVLGRQGPLVHICCSIGNVFCRLFRKYNKNEGKRREVLSASAAAGVAVAFGAPIGGVLFSLEEVSYYFPSKTMWRSFFCALMAAVTLKIINPLHTGKLVRFQVEYVRDWHMFDMAGFVLLGVFGV